MENKDETFSYTYSAKQQEEVRRIRQKYTPPEENKMEQLRMLDKGAARRGTAASIAVGTISALVLGVGMCMTMVWTNFFALGVAVGLAGIAGVAAAYPVYKRVTKKQREKLAPQILALTKQLLDEN